MSLLMEALRKAEEAKRKVQQQEAQASPAPLPESASGAAAGQGGFSLEEREPLTPDFIRARFAGRRSSELDEPPPAEQPQDDAKRASLTELESYFNHNPLPEDAHIPPTAPTAATLKKQQLAAASVFNAKQPRAKNKTTWLAVAVLLGVLPLAGGLYWYILNASSSSIGVNPAIANYDVSNRPPLESAAPQAAPTPPATETVAVPPVDEPAPTPAPQTPDAAVPEALPPATAETEVSPAPADEALVAAVETTAAATPTENAVPAGNPSNPLAGRAESELALPPARTTSLQVSRSAASRQTNPQLVSAYGKLQAGEHDTAALLYEEVLVELPNNRDALLGLASVQMRRDNPGAARALYTRLLQLNPRDPLARTGLLQTVQSVDATQHEAELKTLRDQHPDVAPLSFALGNLYAGQQRWSEAQAAYFDALLAARRADGPVSPDYAFNLAVSLEQLNQKAPALDYYRQARELAREVTPGFDPQLLESRLTYLEQNP